MRVRACVRARAAAGWADAAAWVYERLAEEGHPTRFILPTAQVFPLFFILLSLLALVALLTQSCGQQEGKAHHHQRRHGNAWLVLGWHPPLAALHFPQPVCPPCAGTISLALMIELMRT